MKRWSLIIFTVLLIVNCAPELPPTIGRPRKIVLLTNYQSIIKEQIKSILEQEIYTVQPEPEFLVRYEPLEKFNAFVKFHLIFLVGTISEEPIATLINQKIEQIKNDTFGLFSLSEPWAKNQKVLVFATTKPEFLNQGLKRYAPRIRKTFQDYLLAYMTHITYERGYDKKMTKQLIDKYNYRLKVPYGFKLNTKYEADNFIYLVAHNPDRSIFLYSDPQEISLDPLHLIAYRDSLTKYFYDGDFVYKPFTRAETTLFNGILAIKLIGVWQNEIENIGGPFIAYCFNYNQRFYFIDGSLFNPGKRKLDNLNQLDAILRTFTFTTDL